MKELPTYKPNVKMTRKTSEDPFRKLPFIEDNKLFFNYAYGSGCTLTKAEAQEWKEGRREGPESWYLFYMPIGDHPNRERLKDYFNEFEGPPDEIDCLYSSFWQIRLILDHYSCKEKIEDAEYSWEWHKSLSQGSYYMY